MELNGMEWTRVKWNRTTRNGQDRKSTRLNSSHLVISYAVFCLKKKNTDKRVLATETRFIACPGLLAGVLVYTSSPAVRDRRGVHTDGMAKVESRYGTECSHAR